MNKKIISLLAAAVLSIQAIMIPVVANAEAAVTKGDIFIHESDFSEFAEMGGIIDGVNVIPGSGSPDSWLTKGSAGTQSAIFRKTDEGNYANFKSDSVKNGTAGEGSWYWYNRTNNGHIVDKGFMKFDIRMNSGNIELVLGSFTDPTKGMSPAAIDIDFNTSSGQITAASTGGRVERVCSLETGKWYTVQIDIDMKLQEYDVTVTDADGKEVGKVEEVVFVDTSCTEIKTKCFAYIRKENGHDFDLTNVTIARVAGDLVPAKEAVATETPAPTEEPAATTAPTAEKKISLTIDNADMKVNDTVTKLDVPAQIINDRTMVPLRAIFEALDATVEWDGDTRTITGKKGDTTVVMVVDNTEMKVNDEVKTLDTPAQIVNDRTLVPARAISEALGADVQWDGATRTVTITAK